MVGTGNHGVETTYSAIVLIRSREDHQLCGVVDVFNDAVCGGQNHVRRYESSRARLFVLDEDVEDGRVLEVEAATHDGGRTLVDEWSVSTIEGTAGRANTKWNIEKESKGVSHDGLYSSGSEI
jgi:hypothetical protein